MPFDNNRTHHHIRRVSASEKKISTNRTELIEDIVCESESTDDNRSSAFRVESNASTLELEQHKQNIEWLNRRMPSFKRFGHGRNF